MNHLRRIFAAVARRPVVAVPTQPAAFNPVPSPGELGSSCAPGRVRAIAGGRMPGWQITLIPSTAALIAGTVPVPLDRAVAARKIHAPPPEPGRPSSLVGGHQLLSGCPRPQHAETSLTPLPIGSRRLRHLPGGGGSMSISSLSGGGARPPRRGSRRFTPYQRTWGMPTAVGLPSASPSPRRASRASAAAVTLLRAAQHTSALGHSLAARRRRPGIRPSTPTRKQPPPAPSIDGRVAVHYLTPDPHRSSKPPASTHQPRPAGEARLLAPRRTTGLTRGGHLPQYPAPGGGRRRDVRAGRPIHAGRRVGHRVW